MVDIMNLIGKIISLIFKRTATEAVTVEPVEETVVEETPVKVTPVVTSPARAVVDGVVQGEAEFLDITENDGMPFDNINVHKEKYFYAEFAGVKKGNVLVGAAWDGEIVGINTFNVNQTEIDKGTITRVRFEVPSYTTKTSTGKHNITIYVGYQFDENDSTVKIDKVIKFKKEAMVVTETIEIPFTAL